MVHGVVAARQLYAGRRDLEVRGDPANRLRLAGESDKLGVESMHVLGQYRGRIALGVDADQQYAQIGERAGLLHLGELGEGGRANVRTMREAEEHQRRPAPQLRRRERLAGLIDQMKVRDRAGLRQPGAACKLRTRAVELARQPEAGAGRAHSYEGQDPP